MFFQGARAPNARGGSEALRLDAAGAAGAHEGPDGERARECPEEEVSEAVSADAPPSLSMQQLLLCARKISAVRSEYFGFLRPDFAPFSSSFLFLFLV